MTPKAIVDQLEIEIGMDGAPQRLALAIERTLHRYGGIALIEASVRAEQVKRIVGRLIAERAYRASEHGTSSPLVLVGSTGDAVAGFAYVLPTDSFAIAAAKRHRNHVSSILAAIRTLNFSEFETFGAKVLILMGASDAKITPRSGDQGIDFYGHLTLGQFGDLPPPFMRLAHDVKLLFAGQAKHYPTRNLGPDVVRELVGAVNLARSRVFSSIEVDGFEAAAFKVCSPIVILLFTTGGISNGARQLAESAGIIARSGEQLAVFLADNGVGISDVEGAVKYNPDAFSSWIATKT
jgi:Restriction endonuclease